MPDPVNSNRPVAPEENATQNNADTLKAIEASLDRYDNTQNNFALMAMSPRIREEYLTDGAEARRVALEQCLSIGTPDAFDTAIKTMGEASILINRFIPTKTSMQAGYAIVESGPEGLDAMERALTNPETSDYYRSAVARVLYMKADKIEDKREALDALTAIILEPESHRNSYDDAVATAIVFLKSDPALRDTPEGARALDALMEICFESEYNNEGGLAQREAVDFIMELGDRSEVLTAAKQALLYPRSGYGGKNALEFLKTHLPEEKLVPLLSMALSSYGHYRNTYGEIGRAIQNLDPQEAVRAANAALFRHDSVFSPAGIVDKVHNFLMPLGHIHGRKEAAEAIISGKNW